MTAACFANGKYEASASAKCISNILATGFRRIALDLYWDSSRDHWSFCPAQLGQSSRPSNSTASHTSTPTTSANNVLASSHLTGRDDAHTTSEGALTLGQASSLSSADITATASSISATTLQSPTSTTTLQASNTATSDPSNDGDTLVQVGPYGCSPSTDLTMFLGILTAHFDDTENNLNATTVYMIINLHAASSPTNPTAPAMSLAPANLPQPGNYLSDIIPAGTGSYLYTPSYLMQQRANLNSTGGWFAVSQNTAPDVEYFQLSSGGDHSFTPDGWPNEGFIEFTNARRLLAGFGSFDPQMSAYNTTRDSVDIFPSGYLQREIPYTLSPSGRVQSGCFPNPGVTDIASINSSWAIAAIEPTAEQSISAEGGNLTRCGFSPFLNSTIGNTTADQDFRPYRSFAMSTVWAWGPSEPQNHSLSNPNTAYRCAALNATSGFWQAEDCSSSHYCTCRVDNLPYVWQTGYTSASYNRADGTCPSDSGFDVSRTALENSYLLDAWRSSRTAGGIDDDLLWLNFNDLDVATCWVVGQNSTCPYQSAEDTGDQTIIVPTVAAVIVFVLTILTIFVKCAANRQSSKRRRRRGDDGWDYEGVPA